MKKLTSLLLIVCLCFTALAILASCEHDHEFEEAWAFDETNHWRVCKDKSCREKRDSAEHDWAQQEILAENGDLVFDCTVCGARKTEPAPFTPLTAEAWATAFTFNGSVYEVRCHMYEDSALLFYAEQQSNGDRIRVMEQSPNGGPIAIDYMENGENGHYYYNDETESADINAVRTYTKRFVSFEDTHGEDEFADTQDMLKNLLEPFIECFDSFTYDDAQRCYVASSVNDQYSNVSVVILNGKVLALTFSRGSYTYAYEFGYENIAVTLPSVA